MTALPPASRAPEPGRHLALVGPTASAKIAVAIALATARNAAGLPTEIVSCDSMQVYRGMDIGTAKPTAAEQALVRHHLIDTHEVTESVDVAWYQAAARAAIADVHDRGAIALLTGGSGLYVQAVLDDLHFPGTDRQLRERLEAELAERGPDALHDRLAAVDPDAAASILPSNGRRIVRALEVNELTGAPFQATMVDTRPWVDSIRIGWDPGQAVVDAAISTRVESMWEVGFVAEVEALRPALTSARTASRAVGYRQILEAMVSGTDPDAAKAPTVAATRRLARRQRTWFRRDPRVHWMDTPSQIAQILGTLGT